MSLQREASEAATGRSQSARSVHCWETIWFHARTREGIPSPRSNWSSESNTKQNPCGCQVSLSGPQVAIIQSPPALFSSSSEAESAHHQQSRQCQCKVTWCCFGLLPSLGVGSGGGGGGAKGLQAGPLQSQGPPLATKIRAYKAVIDSLLLHRIHSFVTLHAFFQSLLKGLALQDRNRPITKELRRWETTQISTLPGSS